METEKIEIKEMPTKQILETFIAQMVLGAEITVIFNTETGMFEQRGL